MSRRTCKNCHRPSADTRATCPHCLKVLAGQQRERDRQGDRRERARKWGLR